MQTPEQQNSATTNAEHCEERVRLWRALWWSWLALVVWIAGPAVEVVLGEGWIAVATYVVGIVLAAVALRKVILAGRSR
ncbi:hypothetical protein [Micromonospora sp. RP3T]|uniref:hypothetical protein n=1 Tax=Micromonospora sp. RP3T TaxID=2135446 RepID=UPI003D70AD87